MHIFFVMLDVLEFSAGISGDFCVLQVLNFFFALCKAWLRVIYRRVYFDNWSLMYFSSTVCRMAL